MKTTRIHSAGIKVFTLLAFFALAFGVPSCTRTCGDAEPYFKIDNINAFNYLEVGNGQEIELKNNDSVDFAKYYIKCNYGVTYYAQKATPSLFQTNTAMALSCITPGENGSVEGLDTILVITNTNYNITYTAGDTLSPIVSIANWNTDYVTLKEFVSTYKTNSNNREGINIRFTEKPQNLSQAHSFTIIMKLGNGKVFTSTTPKVFIK